MKFLAKENLSKFLDAARAKMTVYVPVDSGKTTDYKAYKPGTTVSKKLKTTRSETTTSTSVRIPNKLLTTPEAKR